MAYSDTYGQSYGGSPYYSDHLIGVADKGLEALMTDMERIAGELIKKDVGLFSVIEAKFGGSETAKWKGRRYLQPLILDDTMAFSAMGETDDYPSAGKTNAIESTVLPRYVGGTIGFTGQALALTQGGGTVEGASDVLTEESERLIKNFRQYMQLMAFGTSTGIIGTVKSYDAGTATVTIYTRSNANGGWGTGNAAAATLGVGATGLLRKNMRILWGTQTDIAAGTVANIGGGTITKVSGWDTFVVNVGTNGAGDAPTANDIIVIGEFEDASTIRNNSYNKPFMGLLGVGAPYSTAEDWELQKVNPTTVPEWKAIHVDVGGAFLSAQVLEDFAEAVHDTLDEWPSDIILNSKYRRDFVDMVADDRRYSNLDVNVGWKAINFAVGDQNVSITFHSQAPLYTAIALLPGMGFYSYAKKPSFDRGPGGLPTFQRVGRKNAFEAFYATFGNLVVKNRARLAFLTGLEPSNTDFYRFGA